MRFQDKASYENETKVTDVSLASLKIDLRNNNWAPLKEIGFMLKPTFCCRRILTATKEPWHVY